MRGGYSTFANVAASSTDAHVVSGVAGNRVLVTAVAVLAGATATDVTFNSFPLSNESQLITVDATGGTYTITFSGQTTGNVAYNASASTVQAALVALSNIAPGDVAVTGADGGPYTIAFAGVYADVDVPQVTCDSTNLTGGGHTATPSTPTAGPVGTGVSATFACGVRTPVVLQRHEKGWFVTNSGEGLSVTTGAGSTVGVHVTYELLRA